MDDLLFIEKSTRRRSLREWLPWTKAARMRRRTQAAFANIRQAPPTDLFGAGDPNFTGLLANIPEAQIQPLPPPDVMLANIRELAAQTSARPLPSRLEMGWIARMRLTWKTRPVDRATGRIDVLFGIPIVEVTDLRPDEWRLLDREGKVIKQGIL